MSTDEVARLLQALRAARGAPARRHLLRAASAPAEASRALLAEAQAARRAEPGEAARLGRWALLLALRSGDAQAIVAAHRSNARIFILWGRPRAALRRLERAAAGADDALRARIAPELANCLAELGRSDEAQAVLRSARMTARAEGAGRLLVLLDLVESNLLQRLEQYEQARQLLERAGEAAEARGDLAVLAATRGNLANVLGLLGHYDEAEALYERTAAFYRAQGQEATALQTEYNQAYLLALRGRFHVALERYERLAQGFARVGDERHVALCGLDRAEIELRLGLPHQAADSAGDAQRAFERMGQRQDAARAEFFGGVACLKAREGARSVGLLERAADELADLGCAAWASVARHRLAEAYRLIDRDEEARLQAQRAATSLYRLGLIERGGSAELLEARMDAEAGRARLARERLEGILSRLGDTHAPWLRCEVHHTLARCHEMDARPDEALHHSLEAVAILERNRYAVPPDEYMAAFLEGRAALYDDAIRVAFFADQPGAKERLFELIEASKGRALLDLLRAERPTRAAVRETELELGRLEAEIDGMQARLLPREPGAAGGAAARRVTDLRTRHERLRACLDLIAAEERKSARTGWHRATTTLAEIRTTLGPDTTMLQYHLADRALFIAVIDQDSYHVRRIPRPRRHFRRLVTRLRFQLDRPTSVMAAYGPRQHRLLVRAAKRVLADAFDDLIAPVRAAITTPRLVVVPEGVLHGVPFHALGPLDGPALLEELDVVAAPSAAIYEHCVKRRGEATAGCAVFGIADADAPAVAEEARRVAGLHADARLYVEGEATRARFAEEGARARILHLASHGTYEAADPLQSGVHLGDGWLRTRDLYDMEIAAETVVLSGCVTGRAAITSADELLGLPRGLLCAGARTLVTSLWHVADEWAARWMEHFHAALAMGSSASVALRSAALATRENTEHPAHWAPFTVMGAGLGPGA